MNVPSLPPRARYAVLFAAIGGLLFDGVELGLMPVASLSVSQSLLGDTYTPTLGGDWFARFTAALMLGARVRTQGQMLVLRFLVGFGVGGVWPNAVALDFPTGGCACSAGSARALRVA